METRKTAPVSGDRKFSGFLVFGCLIFLVWTGILLWSGAKQYFLSGKLEETVTSILLEQGGADAVKLQEATEENRISLWVKRALSQTGSLSYLIANGSKLPRQEKDMEKIAALFAGKNAGKTIWSSAAGKKAQETKLFEKSDKEVAALVKAEKKSGKGTTDEEFETLLSQAPAKENEEESMENMDTHNEDDISVPTQSILLFRNGSPDITSKNKTGITQKTLSQALICDSEDKLQQNLDMIEQLNKGLSRSYLLRKFYITDSSTSIDNKIFQVGKLLTMDMTVKKVKKPQILIFHTHGASESFIDSRKGKKDDSIVGVGEELAKILSKQYGYQVLHDKTEYDRINGKIDRNKAYNNAYLGLQKTLEKYPSIQIIIDLHRDGVGNAVKRTTKVGGKRTAQVMFFNGLSRSASGDIEYLHNDNLQANLAFSLQLKIECMKRFENFAKPVYLKGYRYNMHLRERFTLIELGNENNTVQEAKNAMEPLAMVLDAVLTGK